MKEKRYDRNSVHCVEYKETLLYSLVKPSSSWKIMDQIMKNKLIRSLAPVFVLLLLCGGAVFMFGPGSLKGQISSAFADMGFSSAKAEKIHFTSDSLVFSDIRLDEDGFSTIDRITIRYDLSVMEIKGVRLAALLDADGAFAIAGWEAPTFEPFAAPVQTIRFEDIILDLDTPRGALRFESAGEAVAGESGALDFQARLWGTQNQLDIMTAWNGTIEQSGAWAIDMSIERGRFDFGDFKGSRLGGWVSTGMDSPGAPLKTGGQLTAGMLQFAMIPLQNVRAGIEGNADAYAITLNATGGGTQSLTLEAMFGQNSQDFFAAATIKSAHPSDLTGFLEAAGGPGIKDNPGLAALALLPPLTLEAVYLAGERAHETHFPLALSLRGSEGIINAGAKFEADMRAKTLSGTLTVAQTDLAALGDLLRLNELTAAAVTAGTLSAESEWSFDLQAPSPVLKGPLTVKINDFGAQGQGIALGGLSGKLIFSSAGPLLTEGKQSLGFESLILGGLPLEDGQFVFELGANNLLHIHTMRGAYAGGTLALSPVSLSESQRPEEIAITAKGLDLEELVRAANMADLSARGAVDGFLRVTLAPDNPVIKKGEIKNAGPGFIAYTPDQYPAPLAGPDERLRVVREAVTGLEYDVLALTFSGPFFGEMTAQLRAEGQNRAVFGERPIHINLNLTGALPAFMAGTTNR
jgi:hypothetical protein